MTYPFEENAAGGDQAASLSKQDDYTSSEDQINILGQRLADDCKEQAFSEIKETNKTNETNLAVTNDDFLEGIFGPLDGDLRPVVVSFRGNPQKVPKGHWYGRPWQREGHSWEEDQNNYWSISMYRPDETGTYRRRKNQFSGLYAIYLDDVGTKVDQERVTLDPSWDIETSPGNHQVGYILDEPIKDSALADRLMKAIIAADLCDPGAGGPTARLARLPVAVNGKHDPSLSCCLIAWHPERRYTVEDLVDAFDLEMTQTRSSKSKKGNQKASEVVDDGTIYIPRPHENPVIAALKVKGLYKSSIEQGRHEITCPWVFEHTDGADGGTAYFEPSDDYPLGGFKCFHGHCAERKIKDLLKLLEVKTAPARMKTVIRLIRGEIHRIADQAERELAHDSRHYQRGGLIVTVSTDPGTRDTFVKDLKRPALLRALASVALWQSPGREAGTWVRAEPTDRIVSVIFDASDYDHLPVLNGLARQPYLRKDGSLVAKPGYDVESGMFGVFDPTIFSIPNDLSRRDAEEALATLSDLLAEFSFTNESDKAAALAAILSATIRPVLPLAPMFHVRAPQIGSGKSFLCQLISAFATPRFGAPTTFPQDDEECRKVLLAELLRAPAVIEFDNLTSDLVAHKSLCATLTSEYMTGRILGVSKTATVSTRTLFLSSGNNVGPVADMTRRCITIRLDPQCENPATKEYKRPNLLNDLQLERGRYVSAALIIVRAWMNAGRPMTDCKPVGSYGVWSDLCRQSLLWLGLPDPATSLFEAMNEDPDREILGRLLHAWKANFGSSPKMVRDIVQRAETASIDTSVTELREVLQDIAGDRQGINRKVLGRWLSRHTDRIVDGLRLVGASGTRAASAWRIETLKT